MTKAEIQAKIAVDAEKYGITQYEAAMILYTKESMAEGEAKKNKEKLKEIIQQALTRNSKRAHMVQVPGRDQFATAYHYSQTQPKWDDEIAHRAVAPEVLALFHRHTPNECFTVVCYAESVAKELVEKSNAGAPPPEHNGSPSKAAAGE